MVSTFFIPSVQSVFHQATGSPIHPNLQAILHRTSSIISLQLKKLYHWSAWRQSVTVTYWILCPPQNWYVEAPSAMWWYLEMRFGEVIMSQRWSPHECLSLQKTLRQLSYPFHREDTVRRLVPMNQQVSLHQTFRLQVPCSWTPQPPPL